MQDALNRDTMVATMCTAKCEARNFIYNLISFGSRINIESFPKHYNRRIFEAQESKNISFLNSFP